MNTIKDRAGNAIPLNKILSGRLTATQSAADYGTKAGKTYKVHCDGETYYGYFFADGQIDLNGEMRQDFCDTLIYDPAIK
jgi:hypothetical protein